jgi:hypothetical protein
VGISAKIWRATDNDIRRCMTNGALVDDLFHRAPESEHALLHGARAFGSFLRDARDDGLHAITGASDRSYALFAERVKTLAAGAATDPLRDLLDRYPCDATNRVQIGDVIRRAAKKKCGVLICVFEDW